MEIGEQMSAECLRFSLELLIRCGEFAKTGAGKIIRKDIENSGILQIGKNDIKKMNGKPTNRFTVKMNKQELKDFNNEMKERGLPYAELNLSGIEEKEGKGRIGRVATNIKNVFNKDVMEYEIIYLKENENDINPLLKKISDRQLKADTENPKLQSDFKENETIIKNALDNQSGLEKKLMGIFDDKTKSPIMKLIEFIILYPEIKKTSTYIKVRDNLLKENETITNEKYLDNILNGQGADSIVVNNNDLKQREYLINTFNENNIPFVLYDKGEKSEIIFNADDRDKIINLFTDKDKNANKIFDLENKTTKDDLEAPQNTNEVSREEEAFHQANEALREDAEAYYGDINKKEESIEDEISTATKIKESEKADPSTAVLGKENVKGNIDKDDMVK